MINEELTKCLGLRIGRGGGGMARELLLAAFIMGIGLCVAGAGTHLYQWVARQQAGLRYDGATYLASVGHIVVSFICGPYIMLQAGWQQGDDGSIELGSALISALVAFGWAFITGLLFMGIYVAVRF
jgi:hypothetical protein